MQSAPNSHRGRNGRPRRIRVTNCRVVSAETLTSGVDDYVVDRLVEAVPEGQRPPDDRAYVHALLAEHDGAQHAEQEPNANRTDYVRLHRCPPRPDRPACVSSRIARPLSPPYLTILFRVPLPHHLWCVGILSNNLRVELLSGFGRINFRCPTAEHMWNKNTWSRAMLLIDPPFLLGLSALVTSLSALIWSIRRKSG